MTGGTLHCPFCGAVESERFVLEGRRVIVFPCEFTALTDPAWPEEDLPRHLRATYGAEGRDYFRRQCDRLHYFVVSAESKRAREENLREPASDPEGGFPEAGPPASSPEAYRGTPIGPSRDHRDRVETR